MGKTLLLSLCLHSLLLYAAAVTLVRDSQVFVVNLWTEAKEEQTKDEGRNMRSIRQVRDNAIRSAAPMPLSRAQTKKSPVVEKTVSETIPVMAVSGLPITVSAARTEFRGESGDINSGRSNLAATHQSGAGTVASTAGTEGKSIPDPATAIRSAIERALLYPPIARKRYMEGKVVVRFSIDEKGIPSSVQIVESSGHPMLDDEAIRTVARAAPLPATQRSVEIPINFKLLSER